MWWGSCAKAPRPDPDPDLLSLIPTCPCCSLPRSEQSWNGGELGWVLLKSGEHKWGVSARAEGEIRVLEGGECDQGAGVKQCTCRSSPKKNISAQPQIIQEKNPKTGQDEPGSEWMAETIRKTALTGRNGALKEKVLKGSKQKGPQRKLVMKSHLALEQRGFRGRRHLEEEHGVVVPHKMEGQGQQSAIGIAERGGRKWKAWAASSN